MVGTVMAVLVSLSLKQFLFGALLVIIRSTAADQYSMGSRRS